MDTIYDRIEQLCQERGITGGKMCNDLGVSRSTMTELRKGRVTTLKLEKAGKIADYFGVSIEYLLGSEKEKKPATDGKQEVGLDDFTYAFNGEIIDLTEEDRQLLLSMARQLSEARKQRNGKKTD